MEKVKVFSYDRKTYYELSVGDLVTSDYNNKDKMIIRKITNITKSDFTGSLARASADGGEGCVTCRRQSNDICDVDGAWFQPVKLIIKKVKNGKSKPKCRTKYARSR